MLAQARRLLFYFFVFAFLGFVVETLTIYLTTGELRARGYWFTPNHYPLRGIPYIGLPFIPLYGFGGLVVVYIVARFKKNPFLVFFVGMAVLTFLEFVTGFILLKTSGTRLWDYPPGLAYANGILDVWTTVAWGVLAMIMVYLMVAPLEKLYKKIAGKRWLHILLYGLLVLVILCSLHRDVSLF